jgi:phytoene synthase
VEGFEGKSGMSATPGLELFDGGASMGASSFAPGALLLDAQARMDLKIFYAYCRAIDDCADEFAPAIAARHLVKWKAELKTLAGGQPSSVLGKLLAELCRRRAIPISLLEDIHAGALSDAKPKVRFKTYAGVRQYAYHVAGAVGLACLPIFGVPMDQGGRFALALGEGFQLINILRDVKEDAGRQRLYFAQDDLKEYGLDEKEFMAGSGGDRQQRLFYAYAWRARQALALADAEAARLPRRPLRTPLLMRHLYGSLLEEMAKDGFKVHARRYRLGSMKKMGMVAKALVRP